MEAKTMEAKMTRRRLARVAGVLAILVGVVLAPGSAKSSVDLKGAPAAQPKLTTVNVIVVPSYDEAALFLGAKRGFFKKRGISIHAITAPNGPAGIALVQSGAADLGLIAHVPLTIAVSNGLPLKIVTVSSTEQNLQKPGTSNVAILTRADTGIARYKDLAGKTIGVFSLGAIDVVCTKLAVAKDGGDPSKVNFVALPAANLGPAMDQKQLDAIYIADPFLTQFIGQFHPKEIGDACAQVIPKGSPRVEYYTTQDNATKKKKVLTQFALAVKESVKYARAHVPALKATLSKYGILPPDLVPELRPPSSLNSVWNVGATTALHDVLFDNGFIKTRPDLSALAPMVP